MILISNNCLAGFVYRDILHTKYTSPFIWTAINPDEYIQMIDEYDKLDLENVIIDKEKEGLSNNFDIILCEKYHIHNHHMLFDEKAKTPIHSNSCDISYYKIWEYIYSNWIRRAKRAKFENKKIFLFYDNFNVCKNPYKLTEIMYKHPEYVCIAFTDKEIKPLENLIVKNIELYWNSEPGGWYNSFMNTYKDWLNDFLNKASK